jgi:hypothetical protein
LPAARDGTLKALRRAIEADMEDWNNRPAQPAKQLVRMLIRFNK